MFFYISKLLAFFIMPSNLFAVMIAAGLLLIQTRRARFGKRLAFTGIALLLLAGLSPLGHILSLPLEDRFPTVDPNKIQPPTGIIMLGGGIVPEISASRGQLNVNVAGDRVTEFVALAKKFPDAKLVFTGGSNAIFLPHLPEAEPVKDYYAQLGLDPSRLILEAKSRNTQENASYTRALVKPRPGESWLLVTSAFHMPRSVGCFRKVGFDVIPYPVDFRVASAETVFRLFPSVSHGLRRVDTMTREYIGLVAYWFTGRTSALFPGPRQN